MADAPKKEPVSLTQLAVPVALKGRIDALAHVDRRTYKLEVLALLEEAVTARERKITGGR